MRTATLDCLRCETGPLHRRVEGLLDLGGRCERSGPTGYAHALAALYGIHAALEDRLDRAGNGEPPISDWERRRGKPAWLHADLRQIADPLQITRALTTRPRPESLPTLSDEAAVLGCLYVVEGSMLGGATAARQVRSVLGEGAPIRFFAGYGAGTAAMWRSVCRELNRYGACGDRRAPLVMAARRTFGAFEGHLADVLLGRTR